jgi:Domain of unknown function (DUF4172)
MGLKHLEAWIWHGRDWPHFTWDAAQLSTPLAGHKAISPNSSR